MSKKSNKIVVIILSVLFCLLISLLVFYFIISSFYVNRIKENPYSPSPLPISGYIPLYVWSGSMDNGTEDCIKIGDIILIKECDPSTLVEGDIIAFLENDWCVIHRIIKINDDGTFVTKGDANNTEDLGSRNKEDILGIYVKHCDGITEAFLKSIEKRIND